MPLDNAHRHDTCAFTSTPPRSSQPTAPASDPTAAWNLIAASLRRGDPGAQERFAATYANGARILFRRRIGSVRAEQLLPEALAGAAAEIRLGWIQSPRDLVFFFRSLCGSALSVIDSPAEVARIRVPAARLEELLSRLCHAERCAVRLCYLERKPFSEAIAEAGLTEAEGQRLQRRLQLAFHIREEDDVNAARPPATPRFQAASASGG